MVYDPIRNQIQDLAFDQLANTYLIKQEMSRSQASSLYQAEEIAGGRMIALKVFRRKFSADPRFALNFRNHMRTIFRIESEYLVSVLDYGMADGRYYISSEWIDGQSVNAYMAKVGTFSELQAIAIVSQVCQALDVIHHNGLLHQNLKPHNILLTSDGRVKLSDTGLSGLISESGLSRTHIMLGRYHYISPEQVIGQDLTPESDLYSLGVVMYEMLTGQVPFDSRDVWKVLRLHVESEPPPLSQSTAKVSGSLATIVWRALRKSPELRFSSANEMNAALTAVLMNSIPTQDALDSTSTTAIRGHWKHLTNRGKDFLQRPGPIQFLGKQQAFGFVLLAQFIVSFLLAFLFLTSVFLISRQIQDRLNMAQESVGPAVGFHLLQKSMQKTKLLKQPQSSWGNPMSSQQIATFLRSFPDNAGSYSSLVVSLPEPANCLAVHFAGTGEPHPVGTTFLNLK